jgi:enamine deaminase RidA (YjgF/YER057c/UK114 family)
MGAEARLRELGIELPAAPKPIANYVTASRSGNLLFLSGHGPLWDGRFLYQGTVGRDLTVEQGQEAARLTGLNLLASARDALGSLDRVRRVVKLFGMVRSPEDFVDHPKVINACSDLMVAVFGDQGRHTRSAIGVSSLPLGIAVEAEMILEVSDRATKGPDSATRRRVAARSRRSPPSRTAARRR